MDETRRDKIRDEWQAAVDADPDCFDEWPVHRILELEQLVYPKCSQCHGDGELETIEGLTDTCGLCGGSGYVTGDNNMDAARTAAEISADRRIAELESECKCLRNALQKQLESNTANRVKELENEVKQLQKYITTGGGVCGFEQYPDEH